MEYPLKNDLILRAAKGEKVERIPVWLMRQAGRILPDYRAVRASVSGFKELVETPELVCEVTIQPVDHLDVDAAIIFSDILVVPEAMGVIYEMNEGVGPIFPNPILSEKDIDIVQFGDEALEKLRYVFDSITLTKKTLQGRVPLIGFAGAPWTIFAYMTEGKGSKTFSVAKKWLYNNPTASHRLLEKITTLTIAYLKEQIRCGANMVQVFDSWAGILSPYQYTEFCIPYLKAICDAITEVPVTIFAKGAFFARTEVSQLNCDVIGLDWNMDPVKSRNIIGPNKTLQGNLDPCALYSSDEELVKQVKRMLGLFGKEKYIANLGHGVYPDVDPEKVKLFIKTVKAF